MAAQADEFSLYDLRVETVGDAKQFVCGHKLGEYFLVQGEMLRFPNDRGFSLYALAAVLPLLPAKQRETEHNDWMTTDELIACPDPNCGAQFRVTRTGKRTFRHGEVTVVKRPD
ncbi:MAG: TIGR04076 family protein [Pirellulales bacterium]|nr:TIGR04076 family protein [Pirellulales bacterium]